MPTGVYKHYSGEKHPNWKGGKAKCIDCGKLLSSYDGKYCRNHKKISEETKQKMSNSSAWRGRKRPPFSEEHRKKIGDAQRGKVLSLKHRKKIAISVSKALTGKKFSEDHKRKLSEARLELYKSGYIHPFQGKHHTKDSNRRNSEKKIGSIPWNKGKTNIYTTETIQKIREARIRQKFPYHATSIELKIEKELIRRNLSYQKQIPLCKIGVVDFFLPTEKIVIQCDGDYWHNLPDHKERDGLQNKVLFDNGYKVFRFWEHEINNSPINCINKLYDNN